MKWKSLKIEVSWSTMDPGVVNCDGVITEIEHSDLRVGQFVRYDDPSGLFPNIKVLEVSDKNLTIEVNGKKYELVPDSRVRLDQSGRDYTNFDFEVYLVPLGGPNDVDIDGPESIMRIARNHYEVFALTEEQIVRLKQSDDMYERYLLGRWYWLTHPEKDAEKKAEVLFHQSADAGCADALLSLARYYRYGVMRQVDLDEYVRLRDEARSKGSLFAEIQYVLDMIYGIACEANPPKAIAMVKEKLESEENPDPQWYDVLGWAFLLDAQKGEAGNMFATAALKGFSKAYDGFLCAASSKDVIIKARKAGCGLGFVFALGGARSDFDEASDALKEFYHAELKEDYETALLLGESAGAYYLADAYYTGTYGFPEDDQLAWHYAYRGGELCDTLCFELLAEMIEAGRAPKEFGQEEADFFLLQSLRYGNSDVLSEVVELYKNGRLQDYAHEIREYYVPKYEALLEPEDDNGRWDGYA